jgi:hypothetical protein
MISRYQNMLFVYIILYLIFAYALFMAILVLLMKKLFPKEENEREKSKISRSEHRIKRLSYRMAGRSEKFAY